MRAADRDSNAVGPTLCTLSEDADLRPVFVASRVPRSSLYVLRIDPVEDIDDFDVGKRVQTTNRVLGEA